MGEHDPGIITGYKMESHFSRRLLAKVLAIISALFVIINADLICSTTKDRGDAGTTSSTHENCTSDSIKDVYQNSSVDFDRAANETTVTTQPPPVLEPNVETTKQPIATFDEWTKEKLRQEQKRTEQVAVPAGSTNKVVKPSATSAAARNYASRECGAKVLMANPEAENTKAVLNDKEKDEYMRNPCEKAPHKHFVVELCETIQPRTIELGNFELFSSGPREIKISASERFPTSDWTVVAELVAQDTRSIQTFNLDKRGVYAKFLKIELLSHFGQEHYCTLTVLRVLGMSMVDEYEAEAEMAAGRLPIQTAEPVEPVTEKVVEKAPEKVLEKEKDSTPQSVTTESPPPPEVNSAQVEKIAPVDKSPHDNDSSKPVQKVIKIVENVVTGKLIKDIINVFTPGSKKKFTHLSAFELCSQCPVNGPIGNRDLRFCHYFFPTCKSKKLIIPVVNSSTTPGAPRSNPRKANQARKLRRIYSNFQRILLKKRAEEKCLIDEPELHKPPEQEPVRKLEPVYSQPEQDIGGAKNSTSVEPPLKREDVEPTVETPPHATTQQFTDALPAPSISHKESVFMKLNKRIAALELNMSLSSEYLSELSRQYVAQAELQEKNIERAKRIAEEAVSNATAKMNASLSDQLETMRHEVEQLSAYLARMRSETASIERRIGLADTPSPHAHSIRHYSPGEDGLWTTEQVVYVVVAVQIFSLVLIASLNWCFQKREHPVPSLSVEQVEELIKKRIAELQVESAQNKEIVQNPLPVAESNSKKKRKKNKHKKEQSVRVVPDWDARTSILPTPTPTHSDAGSDSDRRREDAHDATDTVLGNSELEFPDSPIALPVSA